MVQLLWVVLIPPYGGIDEFDHAYRAASVANGHWASEQVRAPHGRGFLIRVPEQVVLAAHSPCAKLRYTGRDNCNPASTPNAAGEVMVASAAATYDPAFYVLVGMAAKPFFQSGTATLYAMRIAGLLLCDALLAIALVIVGRTARTFWPLCAVMLVATPMVLYSTAIAAPNGLQACAAVLMWCSLLPAVTRPWSVQTPRLLWVGSSAAAVVMLTHSTGPLWVFLSLIALLSAAGRMWRTDALLHRGRQFWAPLGFVALVAILSSTWIIWQGTNLPAENTPSFGKPPVGATILQPVLWIFQSVAAIPLRNQAAPLSVYAVALLLFTAFIMLSWPSANWRVRRAMLLIATLSLLVPLALSLSTYQALGFAWQGRYTLPFAFGIVFAAAFALDANPPLRPVSLRAALVTAVGLGYLEGREVLYVGFLEHQSTGAWAHAVIVVCCLVSTAMLCGGALLLSRSTVDNKPAQRLFTLA